MGRVKHDEFGVGVGLVGFAGVVADFVGVVGIFGGDGDEVAVVVLVVAFALEFGHVSVDGGVSGVDGDPVDEEGSLGVDSVGIFGFSGVVEAFSEVAAVGGGEIGVAGGEDAFEDFFFGSVP